MTKMKAFSLSVALFGSLVVLSPEANPVVTFCAILTSVNLFIGLVSE